MADYTTRRAVTDDLAAVLGVQHRAFSRVARAYDIPVENLPPITETHADLLRLMAEGMRFFVATESDGGIVGSVRGRIDEGIVEIGRLVVDDGWQRQGVATALMDELERSFADARRFELFTGAEASVPLALYAKRGYATVRTDNVMGVDLVWLEKPGPAALR